MRKYKFNHSYKYKAKCPFCKARKHSIIFKKSRTNIARCDVCSLGFLLPMPSDRSLEELYSRDYFEKETGSFGYKNYLSLEKSLSLEAKRKIKYIRRYKNGGDLLDVGAGMGIFAKASKLNGYNPRVLDISSWAVDYIKREYQIKGWVSDFSQNQLPRKKFDLVTAWDVIEHIKDPNAVFKAFNILLKKNGYLFITTPNLDSIDAKIFGKSWYGYKKIPEHVLYFTPHAISRLAIKNNFKVVEIRMWGFVRDIDFILEKVAGYNLTIGKIIGKLFSFLRLNDKNIYFPFIDMLVVLKKEKEAQ